MSKYVSVFKSIVALMVLIMPPPFSSIYIKIESEELQEVFVPLL